MFATSANFYKSDLLNSGPEAGLETVELTLAVFSSFAAGGKKVTLPLVDREHPLR